MSTIGSQTVTPEPATVTERAARGRAARREVPRSTHAEWAPPGDRRDPIDVLEEQATSRDPDLVPIRHGRMAASPFAFFRGGAQVMASDLAQTSSSGIAVQLCGDAHLSNFGGFAAPDRRLVFDLNDFDETLPGPWEWDVKRLAASVAIAARERGLGVGARRRAVMRSVAGYRRAMATLARMRHLDLWYSRVELEARLATISRRRDPAALSRARRNVAAARRKDSLRAFSKLTRTVNGEPRLISDPPLIVPIAELVGERGLGDRDVDQWIRDLLRAYGGTLRGDVRRLVDGYRCVDLARKVVGVGSVGTRAWIALMLGRDGDDPLFLQVKEAQRSALEPFLSPSEFANQGQRVVEGQRLMQAAGDVLLGWIRTVGLDGQERDFYIRQMWDWKLSAEVGAMRPVALELYSELCGETLARAHARGGDAGDRRVPRPRGSFRPRARRLRRGLRGSERARLRCTRRRRRQWPPASARGRLKRAAPAKRAMWRAKLGVIGPLGGSLSHTAAASASSTSPAPAASSRSPTSPPSAAGAAASPDAVADPAASVGEPDEGVSTSARRGAPVGPHGRAARRPERTHDRALGHEAARDGAWVTPAASSATRRRRPAPRAARQPWPGRAPSPRRHRRRRARARAGQARRGQHDRVPLPSASLRSRVSTLPRRLADPQVRAAGRGAASAGAG